jgi:3',5'-cyclic AMP phosphodiesterase CpdA
LIEEHADAHRARSHSRLPAHYPPVRAILLIRPFFAWTLHPHGLSTLMLLAQISDLHIKRPGKLAYGRVDTAAYLSRCIEHLNALDPRPDAVLITGDLVDFGDTEEYAYLRTLLNPLAIPYYLCIGNHDGREALREVFGDHAYLRDQARFVQYAFELGGVRIVVADSQDPPHGGGRLCDERLDWIAETLARSAAQPTLLAMHHPPFDCGIEHMDEQKLDAADAAKLAAIVARHPQIERLLCGHVHRAIQMRFAGTIASVCPSTAHQVALDLRKRGPSRFVMEPPAFQLHRYVAGEGLVTHTAFIGDYGGAYPFYDENDALID